MSERKSIDLFTLQELADELRISRFTLSREYRKLGIPFVKVGGSLRFPVGQVRDWLEARTQSSDVA
jgi:excisionase family DNA binding protein